MALVEGIGFKNIKSAGSVSFAGHNLSTNDRGEKTYKFFIPKVMYNNAKVVLRKFSLDNYGNIDTENPSGEITFDIPKGQQFVEVNPEKIDMTPDEVLGYRFVIDGSTYYDKHKSINTPNGKFNLADMLSTDVLETPKSIYHIMPGTFNPRLKNATYTNALGETVVRDDKTAVANHFMKFDTTIQDIIDKIPHIKQMGFRRLLATPIFGQDNVSTHGYWTNNPFQITSRYGTVDDFKKLQIELFKNSMGYIADGAFTNEGFMGIHLRDILRNGKNSPFRNWFELFNYPDKPIKIGVLPDIDSVYKNLEIRVVNSPIIWSVDKNGKPTENFGKPNRQYNPETETYIQIYDKRLTSTEQLKKDEVFTSYDIKNTPNSNDISDWQDSIHPYAFPVRASEILKRAKAAKYDNLQKPKDYLMRWDNFELTNAKDSSGILLWTGTKDIPKLRFVFPESKKQDVLLNSASDYVARQEIANIEKATEDVQNYIISVGKFWTNKTAKTLREYVANQLGSAKSATEFKHIIDMKASKTLPVAMQYLTVAQIQNAINDDNETISMLQVPESIKEAFDEYPLEALEVNDDLTSIFAYPSFKKDEQNILYPKMERLAADVLKKLDKSNLPYGKFFDGEDLNYDNLKTLQLISDDIKRFLIIKSLSKDFSTEDIFANSKETYSRLKNISAKKFELTSLNPSENEKKLISIMNSNLSKISSNEIQSLVGYLSTKLKNITPENLKVADLILDKSEAGLNWRIDAAKDIADVEGFAEGENTAPETWGKVFEFWRSFNDGIKLYNAHSYKIAEFTDTAISFSETGKFAKSAGDLEDKIIEQGGFTTQTNYNYLFDLLQRFYTSMPEVFGTMNANAANILLGKLDKGWNGANGYLSSGSKNNVVFSHVAVGNHDKQRVSHTFSINALLAYRPYRNEWGEVAWNSDQKKEIMDDLLSSSMEKSGYHYQIARGNFDEVFKYISQPNLAKLAAYTDSMAKAISVARISASKSEEIMQAFSQALDTLASKTNLSEKLFFYKNFESTYLDILNVVKKQNPSMLSQLNALRPLVHKALLEPAMIRGQEVAKLMVALPGSPTLYAGDELAELGGEERAKNFSAQNRNRIHWENLGAPDYKHITDYKDTLAKIFNLRNDSSLTSLVTGDTILLRKQATKYNRDVVGMYRYNEHDDSIILMNNCGYNSTRHFGMQEPIELDRIDMSHTMENYSDDNFTDSRYKAEVGLPYSMKLIEGTKFVNALDPSQLFTVGKDGNIYNANKNSKIILRNSVVILKRV